MLGIVQHRPLVFSPVPRTPFCLLPPSTHPQDRSWPANPPLPSFVPKLGAALIPELTPTSALVQKQQQPYKVRTMLLRATDDALSLQFCSFYCDSSSEATTAKHFHSPTDVAARTLQNNSGGPRMERRGEKRRVREEREKTYQTKQTNIRTSRLTSKFSHLPLLSRVDGSEERTRLPSFSPTFNSKNVTNSGEATTRVDLLHESQSPAEEKRKTRHFATSSQLVADREQKERRLFGTFCRAPMESESSSNNLRHCSQVTISKRRGYAVLSETDACCALLLEVNV